MTALRTGGDHGNLEIDIRLKGFGRFRQTSGTTKLAVRNRRIALVKQLAENGQLETLGALKAGSIQWPEIEAAQKQQRLNDSSLLSDIKVNALLFPAIKATKFGTKAETKAWYTRTLAQLKVLGFSGTAKVKDLKRDDWVDALTAWAVTPARKNGLRRAVSRFLSRYLGDKYHPFRRGVLHEDVWPIMKERKRLRGVSLADFWRLMALVPERLIPAYVTLAVSGMRVGELLNDDALELDASEHLIYPEGKTGPGCYAVAPEMWEHVTAAVPCRVARVIGKPVMIHRDPRYRKLADELRAAGQGIGIKVTMHDLRRLYARTGEARMGLVATQTALGHASPGMTAEYARYDTKREVAAVVASELLAAQPKPQLTKQEA